MPATTTVPSGRHASAQVSVGLPAKETELTSTPSDCCSTKTRAAWSVGWPLKMMKVYQPPTRILSPLVARLVTAW